MAKNGTLKTLGIITGIIIAIGGTIWALATQSSHLDYTRGEVVSIKGEVKVLDKRTDTVEKAVIKIETKMDYVQKSQDTMMAMQEQILTELRK